jgi:hypothetical protein
VIRDGFIEIGWEMSCTGRRGRKQQELLNFEEENYRSLGQEKPKTEEGNPPDYRTSGKKNRRKYLKLLDLRLPKLIAFKPYN